MAKKLAGNDFIKANGAAAAIAEAAIVAYYMDAGGFEGAVNPHAKHMRDSLERLCVIMGLRVVDATDTPQHRHNVEAMLQSARDMAGPDE